VAKQVKKTIVVFAVLLLLPKTVDAEITEGKSSVHTSVTNNVNTSSNSESETKTHIEIEVNGEKKVLDTNEPGTHTLSIESDGGKSSASVNITNDNNSVSENSESDDEGEEDLGDSLDDDGEIIEEVKEQTKENKNLIEKIIDEITTFFDNIFSF
jgi:hypothetical protein